MILRHGWHGMQALMYMIEDDARDTMYRDYTATMQRHLVQFCFTHFGGKDWEPPSWMDLAHPQDDAPKKKPSETKEDAKAHIYALFGAKPPEGR